ncbi:serine/threonine protein kinase, partial [Gamsiella multidivaricata]
MNNSTAVKQRNNLYNDHQASTQLEDSVDSLTVNAVPSTSASRTDVKLYPAVTITRSTTVISATSHNGRTKLTRRLSYLAHAGDLEDGAEQNIVVEGPDQVLNNLPEAKGNSPGGKEYFLSTKNHPQRQSPQSAVSPAHRSGGPKSRLFQDMNATGPVPIPKLYRRLLQVFRPPLESLDFDSGVPSADPIASVVNRSQTHGPLGLPSRSQNNNNNNDSSNNCGSLRTLPPNQKPSIDRARISSSAAAAAPNTKVTSPIHRPPESTGFRVRFLKKLMSSPNLNTVVHPMAVAPDVAAPGPCVEFVPAQVPPLPYSAYPTLTSDFEHEHSCPVSQRIQERCNGGRPSAVRLPREPARTPTLQSKYGVPGRELGAGTQAQVMLLRAKSPKKLKGAVITTASIERPTSADLRPEDAFLSPRLSSGMMTMTTEDEVTPEQREAYRRRLLQRTNTDQLPVNAQGGLIYAIKKFRPPKATETHRQYLKKVCAEFCISTSMDHENIIRTIDLVRDQPGQDLDDDDDDDGGDNNRDKVEEQQGRRGHYEGMGRKADEQRRDDDKDCSCPREHRRRVRAVESVSGSGMRSGGDDRQHTEAPSYPTALRHPHRSVPRRPVSVRAQRRRSVDSSSNRSSVIGAQDDYEGQYGYRHTQHLCHHAHHHRDCRRQQAHHHFQNKQQAEVAVTAATKKMKKRQQQQRLEQEMRRREVQRLKKQRQLGKKQHAKQLRLEQFPEYCMVMEFAAGGDLFQLLTRSSPPIGLLEKYCLWRQLVNGVQHMHSMGVA